MFQQPLPRCDTKGVLINCGSVTIRLRCANGVYASDKAPQPFQRGGIADFRRPSALPREQGKTIAVILMQTVASRIHYRRHNGYLLLNQLAHKLVLFENRRIAPALWPVKLSDHSRRVIQRKLIHAVFIAVQRQQTTITMQAATVNGIKHQIGRQVGEGNGQSYGEICSVIAELYVLIQHRL
jgi:hypothetical protein